MSAGLAGSRPAGGTRSSGVRVTVLAELAVQYMAPLFARLSREPGIDLTVLYCSPIGTGASDAPLQNFGRRVVWDVDLLVGYRSHILANPVPADPFRRWTMLNPGLVRHIRSDRCDVLVNLGWAFPANWLAVALARRAGIPMLLLTDTDVRDGGLTRFKRLRRAVLTFLCGQAAGALYTGTFNRDFYVRHGMDPGRLWFSPWSVDNERFGHVPRDAARAELGLDPEVCYFLTAGTLIERKRPRLAVEAVARLQAEGRRAGLLLVGSGELEDDVRRAVAERGLRDVHLLGFVNQGRMPTVYAASDVLLLTSRRDARATVVNEAMASGLPVVVSSGTGIWGPGDLLTPGREGLVYDVDDADALLAACRALCDPRTRRRMAAAARERIADWSHATAVAGWREAVAAVAPAGERAQSTP